MEADRLNKVFMEVCTKLLLNNKQFISNYYIEHSDRLADCLIHTLEDGYQKVHDYQESGEKGELRYLKMSFLMSGQFSGENLVKVDFYDKRFYGDPYEIDCYWDYGELFPSQKTDIEEIACFMRKELIKVMDFEVEERLSTYWMGKMQLLQMVLMELLKKQGVRSVIAAEAGFQVDVLYGAYLGSSQRLYVGGGEKESL